MKLDLPVMAAALLAAAALQCALPGIPSPGGIAAAAKVQLLPAVALYYILARPWQLALCAALWAGVLADARSFGPGGMTTVPLLVAAIAGVAVRDASKRRGAPLLLLQGAALSLFVLAAQRINIAIATFTLPQPAAFLDEALRTVPPAAIFAFLAFRALSRIDLLAENISPEREGGAA